MAELCSQIDPELVPVISAAAAILQDSAQPHVFLGGEQYLLCLLYTSLENNGISCCCLPVDEDGLSIRALSESGAAVCYVTPSHQFPTGVTMPAGRRAELLHWAARRPGQRYIIEDDYDSEFRFDTRPLPSLQGMAGADGQDVYKRQLPELTTDISFRFLVFEKK